MSTKPKKEESLAERRERLMNKAFVMMLQVLVVFAVPGLIGVFLGRWIDRTYETGSFGSLIASAVAIVLSWAVIIKMYKKLKRDFAQLEKEEKEEEEREKDAQKSE